jgi:hypothetical protein
MVVHSAIIAKMTLKNTDDVTQNQTKQTKNMIVQDNKQQIMLYINLFRFNKIFNKSNYV